MGRDAKDVRVVFEDVLRPVAMMHVVIDDGDLRRAIGARVRGGDRDVVVQTESHRAIALGVMAGGPHQRERAALRAAERMVDGLHRGTGRQQCNVMGLRRCVGVGIELDGAAGRFGDAAQVVAIVDAQQLLARGGRRRDHVSTPRDFQRPATTSMTSARSGRSG